ncbi:MAG: DNA polymerase III subunit delta [Rhodothermales bacterium]|nr:DNA polymerase III subunit delta [Rhodothermales bacterium]
MAKNTGLRYEDLDAAFRHGNFKPLYFFYGEEGFLMDELQRTLAEHALAPAERDFNFDLVYGAEAEASQVLGLCTAFPMMAARRVVVVRGFDKLADNRRFAAYAEHPNPSAVVLLLCDGKPNLSMHPYRALKQHAVWAEFKPLYDRELPGWIRKRAEALGRRIEPRAVQMLADYVGTDLRTAAAEIDKLVTYAGDRTALSADDVLHASGQTREFNVFELQKAIGEGRFEAALPIAERLLSQASNARGEALMIVAVLTSYFTKLWKLAAFGRQRLPDHELARRIGVPPFYVKEYQAALRRFPLPALERAFAALLSADYELKGGARRDERLVLLLLLRRLVPAVPAEAPHPAFAPA